MSTRYKPIDNYHAAHPKKDLRKNINSRGEKVVILLTKTTEPNYVCVTFFDNVLASLGLVTRHIL